MDRSFQLFPDQASTIAPKIDMLALFILGVTVFFTLLILVLVAYFALRYRRNSKDIHLPNPPDVHTSTALEVAWSGIPLVLVHDHVRLERQAVHRGLQAARRAQEIHIIGKQWMWKAEHGDGRREINDLTVPMGRPIKLVMTSQDVLHDFDIPAFRVKQDVLPGRYSYEWFTPTKPGHYHLYLRRVLRRPALGHDRRGPRAQRRRLPAVARRHAADRPAGGGRGGLVLQRLQVRILPRRPRPLDGGLYGTTVPVMEGDRRIDVKVDEDYLRESILYPRAKIAIDANTKQPYPADLMPGYQGQMTEEQLMQLIAYIKGLGQGAGPGAGGQRMDPGIKMREEKPDPAGPVQRERGPV